MAVTIADPTAGVLQIAGAVVLCTLSGGVVTPITAVGTGDVVGPVSSTDNAVARFDLTTGKLIQNSTATISDSGGLTLTSTTEQARIRYDASNYVTTTIASTGAITTNQVASSLYQQAWQLNGATILLLTSNNVATPGAFSGMFVPGDNSNFFENRVRFGVDAAYESGSGLSDGGAVGRIGFVAAGTQRMLLTATLFASAVPFRLPNYTVATAPSAVTAGAGAMIYFTDSSTAPVAGISDGTVWKRSDNAATTVIA